MVVEPTDATEPTIEAHRTPVGQAYRKRNCLRQTDYPTSHVDQNADGSGPAHATVPALSVENDSSARPSETEVVKCSQAQPGIKLSDEQLAVLNRVKNGENVFFTGSAGTGKSVLLREIISWCRERYGPDRVAVTASTGIAAVNIGGCTLHSWAKIKLGKRHAHMLAKSMLDHDQRLQERALSEWHLKGLTDFKELEELIEKHRRSPTNAAYRWGKCAVLIIDEISMVDGKLFDKLEYIASVIRGIGRPFGGIQLVLSGDFLQLPPVPDRDKNGVRVPSTFAFEAFTWSRCIKKPVYLKQVFRQKEQDFIDMLNSIRVGKLTYKIVDQLYKLARPLSYDDQILPTEVYPTKEEVRLANTERLQRLPPPYQVYHAIDAPGKDYYGEPLPDSIVEQALKDMVALDEVPLKIGAQVMLIVNLVQGRLVNGSRGRVVDFITARQAYKQDTQIGLPQCLRAEDPIDPPDEVLGSDRQWPLVLFENASGKILCVENIFEGVNASGEVEATRRQVPLILSWALSVHKCQGQTLERVKVDLGSVFEHGQAYVALSRATSMKTLEVTGFHPVKVSASPRVLGWIKENSRDEVDDDLEFWAELIEERGCI